MKNVGIITVYYTENCGSVLQAKCLSDILAEMNCNVQFISTKNKLSGHSIKRLIKNCIKKVLKGESCIPTIKKYKSYSKFIKKNFKVVNNKNIEKLDAIYFGSDTIWDIDSEYFLLSQDIFWGINLKNKMHSYAASIANSSYSKLDTLKYPKEQLSKFKNLSARDIYTKEYIDTRTNKKAEIVCDPTLLFDSNYYKKYISKKMKDEYILLYLFDEPTSEIKKQIISYSKKENLKIICLIGLGKIISFADEYIESTIENFITYFYNAKYIITNTFHGTIFSIIFNKNFMTLDYNKVKVTELLNTLCLKNRLEKDNIEKILNTKIDYEEVNKKILELRDDSKKYLRRTLK